MVIACWLKTQRKCLDAWTLATTASRSVTGGAVAGAAISELTTAAVRVVTLKFTQLLEFLLLFRGQHGSNLLAMFGTFDHHPGFQLSLCLHGRTNAGFIGVIGSGNFTQLVTAGLHFSAQGLLLLLVLCAQALQLLLLFFA